MAFSILVVEDDIAQRKILTLVLEKKLGFHAVETASGREALDVLRRDDRGEIRLALVDYVMPEIEGLDLLQMMKQQYPALPVIMLTGSNDVEVAVEAMRRGAADFLIKPPEPERLRISLQNALRMSALEKEVTRLNRQKDGLFGFGNLIGCDQGLSDVVKVGRKAAAADVPVLLLGETGVGKEVFARAIHGESRRAGKPFVAVNCGAIPAQLVESTLFGHEKGAFTGAVSRTTGRFREADGGTIFLDEIGELPLDAQVKLLRVLQQKEVVPVGSSKAVPVNIRIISATNQDVEKKAKEGKFRDDLYFRLNVLPVHLPPLRERRKDVPALVRHFMERFFAAEGLPFKNISAAAVDFLQKKDWPGNVRELENTVHRAIVLSEGETLEQTDFSGLSARAASRPAVISQQGADASGFLDPQTGRLKTMERLEADAMKLALRLCENNVTQAAEMLGMARSTFYRKVREFSLFSMSDI